MPDPVDPVEAQRVIEQALYEAEVDGLLRSAGRIDIAKRIVVALAALPAPEPTLTGEETVNWYGLLRSAAAILPEVETPERLLVAARNLAADIDAALAPYPTSFYLPSAAPVPEGVPEDHRVCSHGIYHHGCPSCDRQDPEERL